MVGLEPLAEGLGGVGGAEALDRIAEEGLPCRLWHDGLRRGFVRVGRGAGAHLLEGMHHVHPIVPSRSPGPLHSAAELLQSGGRPPGEVGGGPGGGGVRVRGPGAAWEDVDLRWWRGRRCLGERERRWRGLGVEDGYRRRGEREGEVDMGRRWRAWWRPGEREWRWRGLGVVDGYGRRGERGAWRGLWGQREVDMGQQWRAWRRQGEREGWWRGLGVGVLYGRRGEGEVDMGRRWRSWWRLREREWRERGLGGSWWHLGERERRELVVEARWRCEECGPCGRGSESAAVCGTGPHRSSRASQEASAGPGGLRVVPPGTGGDVPHRPWIRHVGVWWRQRLVVWVE